MMSVIIVFCMRIMSAMVIVFAMIIMMFLSVSIFFLFFFTEHICFVPSSLYEYLKSRVEVNNEDKKNNTNNQKYNKKE